MAGSSSTRAWSCEQMRATPKIARLVRRTPRGSERACAPVSTSPTAQSLRSMPVEMDIDVHELPRQLLRDVGLARREVHGKVSVRGELRGSANVPTGKVVVSLMGGALGPASPTDASLVATASTTG